MDDNAKLGFHRFYVKNALAGSSLKMFTGQDLDDAQKVTAALFLYIMKMGVDARLITVAAEAGPSELRWLQREEARELRVIYEPSAYKPWRVEPYRGGAIAVSESHDGLKRLVASCSKRLGPYVALIDATTSWDVAEWLNQCRNMGTLQGGHAVFGTRIDASRVHVIRRREGGAVMRFQLPGYDPPLTTPELLTFENYPRACSTNQYRGSRENFVPAVQLALRNCHQD